MQESRVNAAIFQEAVYKLSDYLQREQFMPGDIFEPYAVQFAPDSTPDEIDSLLSAFPQISHGPRGHLERIHHSSLIGFFGAIALHAGNEALREHSLWQIDETNITHTYYGGNIGLYANNYLMTLHGRLGDTDKALELAKAAASDGEDYNPERHMLNVERILQDLTRQDLATAPVVIKLSAAVQAAQAAHEAKSGQSLYSKVVSDSMVKLYATNPHEVTAFCEEYKLHTDLVLAKQAQGERVPFKLLKQAERSTPTTFIEKLQLITALVQSNRHKAIEALGASSHLGIPAREYKDEVAIARVKHQAAQGNYKQALLGIRDVKTIVHKLEATTTVQDAIIATGNVEMYYDLLKFYDLRQGSAAYYTVPMCMRKGDYDTAIQLIQAEDPVYHINAWEQFVKGFISYEAANNNAANITVDTITSYLQRAEDPNKVSKQAHSYAEVYTTLRQHNLTNIAYELMDHIKHRDNALYNSFRACIRSYIQQDLIASGNWLEVMHGDHLSHPFDGLAHPSDLLLVMGGIHRERHRSKN